MVGKVFLHFVILVVLAWALGYIEENDVFLLVSNGLTIKRVQELKPFLDFKTTRVSLACRRELVKFFHLIKLERLSRWFFPFTKCMDRKANKGKNYYPNLSSRAQFVIQ